MKLIPLEEAMNKINKHFFNFSCKGILSLTDDMFSIPTIDHIATIDEMIKVLEYNKKVTESNTIFLQLEAQEYILKELKSKLSLTQK